MDFSDRQPQLRRDILARRKRRGIKDPSGRERAELSRATGHRPVTVGQSPTTTGLPTTVGTRPDTGSVLELRIPRLGRQDPCLVSECPTVLSRALPSPSVSSPSGFTGQLSPKASSGGEPDEVGSSVLHDTRTARVTIMNAIMHHKISRSGSSPITDDSCTAVSRIPSRPEGRDSLLD